MINLLPPNLKEEYRYARRNSGLLRVIAVFCVGFVGLAAIVAAGTLYVHQSASTYAGRAEELKGNLKLQKQEEVKAQVQDMSSSLKLAVQVLSQEVLFSQLLTQLATAIPRDASLTGITISELQGAVDISARAVDYEAATQVQVNLSDPENKIFSKADILSISCSEGGETGGADSRYPCSVGIRAQFAENNPYLFINDKAAAQ